MEWMCAEVRDPTTLATLKQRVRTETENAQRDGTLRADALVYIAPFKKWHRVIFNRPALALLPVLQQLAYDACEAPEDSDKRWATA